MKKTRFTAIFLCLTTIFALFTGGVYAQNTGGVYIGDTTLVVKDGKVVSGDASLVDRGFVVIGNSNASENDEETTDSGKQPVKDDSDLYTPEGSTGEDLGDTSVPQVTPKYVSPTLSISSAARSIGTAAGIGNDWDANSYDLMVLHTVRTLSSGEYTMNIAILARGIADDSAPLSSGTRNFKGEMFNIDKGTLNITNKRSTNSGNVTLEGLRVKYTAYSGETGGSTFLSQVQNENRWSNKNHSYTEYNPWASPTEWYQPLIIVDGGTINIYDNDEGDRVYIQNSIAGKNGAAIQVNGGTAKLTHVTIRHCKTNKSGGGVYVGASGTATLKDVIIDNCHATDNGGGIYVESGGILTLDNVEIKNCTAGYGGGIFLAGDCTLTIKNSLKIHNNTASTNGGGIWFGPSDKGFSFGSVVEIYSNEAGNQGGGMALARKVTVTIAGADIYSNKAKLGGGVACYAHSTHQGNPKLILNSGKIRANTATELGGGIYINSGAGHQINNTTTTANNSAVYENKAPKGAGIYVVKTTFTGASNGKVTINQGKLYGNQASTAGGGVYVDDGGTLVLSGGTTAPIGLIGADSTGSGNRAVSGAGVYVAAGGIFTMSSGVIKNNGYATDSFAACSNGGGVYIAGGTFNLSGASTISGNYATTNGGGIYATGACVLNITGNSTVGNTRINSNKVDNYGGGIYLGAITTADNLKITNCTLDGNIATDNRGGGLYISLGTANAAGIVRVTNAVFNGNKAEVYENESDAANDTDIEGHGGGIYATNVKLYIDGCTFTGNTATVRGGGVYCTSLCVAEIKNSTFTGNQCNGIQSGIANGRGGGLYAYNNAEVTVINSTFDNNSSNKDAGAIGANGYQGNKVLLTLADVYIGQTTANVTVDRGGGVFVLDGVDLKIVRGVISNNQACYGGGIFAEKVSTTNVAESTLQISNSTSILTTAISGLAETGNNVVICGNVAKNNNGHTSEGGGVWIGTLASASIENADIDGNSVPVGHGGGIYIARNVASPVSIKNCNIRNNTVGSDGGGVYTFLNSDTNSITVNFTGNNVITGNTAGSYGGGAIVRGGSTVNINISDGGTTTIDNNQAKNGGGGVHVAAEGIFNMVGGTISGNHGPLDASGMPTSCRGAGVDVTGGTANLKRLTIANNKAGTYGGGFSASNYGTFSDIVLEDLTVNNNLAIKNGGGIYITDDTALTITSTAKDVFKITNNRAGASGSTDKTVGYGGGLLIHNLREGTSLALINLLIEGNTATTNRGGGAYINFSEADNVHDVTVSNVTFKNNTSEVTGTEDSTGHGGGLYIAYSNLDMDNCLFTENHSTLRGAGLYLAEGTHSTVDNTVFTGNRCEGFNNTEGIRGRGGAAYAFNNAVVTFTSCEFYNNHGRQSGGAVGSNGTGENRTTVELVNCTIGAVDQGNSSLGEGGGIHAYTLTDFTVTDCTVTYNTAGQGGGIMVDSSTVLEASGTVITYNTANGSFEGETAKVISTSISGTGGGVAVFDGGSFSLTSGSLYGNTAGVAGNDVFANGMDTKLSIPAPDDMTISDDAYADAMWFEDYMTGDKKYGEGLNGDSRLVDRYENLPIAVRAYTSEEEEGISPSGQYINTQGEFVSITFNVSKYTTGSITITAPTADNEAQMFVFTLVGTTNYGEPVSLSIALGQGETVTIAELIPGDYTVTFCGGWSWRYSLTGAVLDGVSKGVAEAVTVTIVGEDVGEVHNVAYAASVANNYWLNFNSPVQENVPSLTTVAALDMAEGKKGFVF